MAGQATEMQRVVDEADDDDDAQKRLEQTEEVDWDELCAYQTYKVVRVKDRYLGCMYWTIVTFVIMYITIIIFNIEGRQAERATALGTVVVRFKGKATANGKVFDEADLRHPAVEPNGAFILTKRITVKDQTIGRCVDMDFPRHCPCREGERCVEDYCETQGWCPSLGDKNVHSPPPGAVIERMEGLEHTVLQIMVGVSFPGISDQFFVAGSTPLGTQRYKNLTLGELFELADPPVALNDVLDRGALIGISFSWDCDVMADCEPYTNVKWLDLENGFSQKRSWHKGIVNGKEVRDAMYMYGIRLIVDSQGVGRKTSPVLIVIQLGSCLALLRLASIVTDFFMLNYGTADRKRAYYKCKVVETDDYSDLQDRINLIKDQKNDPNTQLIGRHEKGAGTSVPLGLGPGARGGLASTLIRGRGASTED